MAIAHSGNAREIYSNNAVITEGGNRLEQERIEIAQV